MLTRKADALLFYSAAFFAGIFGFALAMCFFFPDAKLTDWTSFVGAFAGAAITVLGSLVVTYTQIREQEKSAENQRLHEVKGARAVLTSDLSAISVYLSQGCEALRSRSVTFGPPFGDPPALDLQILLRLQKLVTLMRDENGDFIASLMGVIQIHKARMEYVINQLTQHPMAGRRLTVLHDGVLRTTLSLAIRIDRLFPYARREVDRVAYNNFSQEEIRNATFLFDLSTLFEERVLELVATSLQNKDPHSIV